MNSLRASLPELAEPLLGEAAIVAEVAAPTLLPGLGLGMAGIAGLNYVEDHMRKEQDDFTAVKAGEVTFEVDGKTVPAKTFHHMNQPSKVESQSVTFKRDEDGLLAAYNNPLGLRPGHRNRVCQGVCDSERLV